MVNNDTDGRLDGSMIRDRGSISQNVSGWVCVMLHLCVCVRVRVRVLIISLVFVRIRRPRHNYHRRWWG